MANRFTPLDVLSPEPFAPQSFDDPAKAVEALTELYERNTAFLINHFTELAKGAPITARYRAFYPQISIETTSFGHVDSRLSYGHVTAPGVYTTTITRPHLFRHYLRQQMELLMRSHNVPVVVSESATPIPLHFAFGEGAHVEASAAIFMFFNSWNDYYGPLLYASENQSAWPVAYGLATFRGQHGTDWSMTMAMTVVIMIPVVVIFFFAQKAFVEGIALTGVKG